MKTEITSSKHIVSFTKVRKILIVCYALEYLSQPNPDSEFMCIALKRGIKVHAGVTVEAPSGKEIFRLIPEFAKYCPEGLKPDDPWFGTYEDTPEELKRVRLLRIEILEKVLSDI